MKKLLPTLLLLPCLPLATHAGDRPALAGLLDDQTALLIETGDLPGLRASFAESPAGRTWDDPDIQRFFAPLIQRKTEADKNAPAEDASFFHSFDRLLKLAKGQAIIAVSTNALTELSAKRQPPAQTDEAAAPATVDKKAPPILIAFEVEDTPDAISEILKSAFITPSREDAFSESTETYGDTDVHTFANNREDSTLLVWAVRAGVCFLSPQKEPVIAALEAQLNGGQANALDRLPSYIAAHKHIGESALSVFANGPAIYRSVVEASMRIKVDGSPGSAAASAAQAFRALGLDALESFYLGTSGDSAGIHQNAGVTWTERRGLFDILAYRKGPVAQPDWVPAEWTDVSTTNFSYPKAVEALFNALRNFNPMVSAMVDGQIGNLNRQLGVDLVNDLIGSLGGHTLFANVPASKSALGQSQGPASFNRFIAISLSDDERFQRTLDRMRSILGAGLEKSLTERDYLGRKLLVFTPPNGGPRVAYSIADRWLFLSIGSEGPVESALQALDARSRGFFSTEAVQSAFSQIPGGSFMFGYQDTPLMLSSLLTSFAEAQQAIEAKTGKPAGIADLSAKPSRETFARYWTNSISSAWFEDNGIHFHLEFKGAAQ